MASAPVNARSVYLAIYSQANLDLVPNRSDFATIVKKALENSGAGNTLVEWWCCCQEKQHDNLHFHVAVKLNMQRWWLSFCNYIIQHYCIQVNCSPQTGNYYNAWEYWAKADKNYVQSKNHPDFTCARKTTVDTKHTGCH